jgi:hypothetical protein
MTSPCENSERISILEQEVMGNQAAGRPSLREEFQKQYKSLRNLIASLGTAAVLLLVADLLRRM